MENGFGFFIVCLKNSGQQIGSCGLAKRDFLDDIDLGFAFLPDYRNKGYAHEAATVTMAHAKNDLGINRLVAMTTQDNLPSIKLLKKLGFSSPKTFVNDGEELFLFSHCEW
jgi:RimJ/RimL family protein N-acetyltransferase